MKTFVVNLVALFLWSATAFGASITSSVCTTSNASVSDLSACNVSGSASASSSASYTISGNSLTVQTYDSTSAKGLGNASSASSSITLDLLTSGPARSGFVLVSGSYVASSGPGLTSSGTGYTIDSLHLSCGSSGGHSGQSSLCFYDPTAQSITLGTGFDFVGDSEAIAGTDLSQGAALGALNLTFQFFEADSVTPVNPLVASPEPGTWVMLTLGLAACASAKFIKRR